MLEENAVSSLAVAEVTQSNGQAELAWQESLLPKDSHSSQCRTV